MIFSIDSFILGELCGAKAREDNALGNASEPGRVQPTQEEVSTAESNTNNK